jgi:hypothetical protein
LTDYLREVERQLRANGSSDFTGRNVDGLRGRFAITRAGLVAAAHREGAPRTRRYLSRIVENGFTSKGLALTPEELAIETRLRTFADAAYEQALCRSPVGTVHRHMFERIYFPQITGDAGARRPGCVGRLFAARGADRLRAAHVLI